MAGLILRQHWRAAIGLIAAYAVALQALFAAFGPVAYAGADPDHLVICFGGNAAAEPASGDPSAPSAPASNKLHCVLCGSVLSGAAILSPMAMVPPERVARASGLSLSRSETPMAQIPVRAGLSRAPPLNV